MSTLLNKAERTQYLVRIAEGAGMIVVAAGVIAAITFAMQTRGVLADVETRLSQEEKFTVEVRSDIKIMKEDIATLTIGVQVLKTQMQSVENRLGRVEGKVGSIDTKMDRLLAKMGII